MEVFLVDIGLCHNETCSNPCKSVSGPHQIEGREAEESRGEAAASLTAQLELHCQQPTKKPVQNIPEEGILT